MGNLIDTVYRAAAGTPARATATTFGALLLAESEIPPVVRDLISVILQSLAMR